MDDICGPFRELTAQQSSLGDAVKNVSFKAVVPSGTFEALTTQQSSLRKALTEISAKLVVPSTTFEILAAQQSSLRELYKEISTKATMPSEIIKGLANQHFLLSELLKHSNFESNIYSEVIKNIQAQQSLLSNLMIEIKFPISKTNYTNITTLNPFTYSIPKLLESEDTRKDLLKEAQITYGAEQNIKENLINEAQIAYNRDEYSFNFKAYGFLCDLEVNLRYLIQQRIIVPYKSSLQAKIPKDILEKWEGRRNESINHEDDLLINYSDFTDLKIIFEKGKNKQLFEDLFNDDQYRALITKLHELDPIRKSIAHFRPLTKMELDRLIIYHYDILTYVHAK